MYHSGGFGVQHREGSLKTEKEGERYDIKGDNGENKEDTVHYEKGQVRGIATVYRAKFRNVPYDMTIFEI